ncbi:MAG TPA: hypothetical protein VH277_13425 [Gemmatimonadaceae bacterium]|nr:hypothetical protein [Gemmatimonadaceae bacterium]
MQRYKPWRPKPTTDSRPPAARLEAFVREKNPDRAERMFDRIMSDAEAAAAAAEAWTAAARELTDRLIVSEKAFCWFAGVFSEAMLVSLSANDPELVRLRGDMAAVERANGLPEYESFLLDDAPPEWLELNEAWDRHADELIAGVLRRCGSRELAELWETSRDEFELRAEEGRAEIWPDEAGE